MFVGKNGGNYHSQTARQGYTEAGLHNQRTTILPHQTWAGLRTFSNDLIAAIIGGSVNIPSPLAAIEWFLTFRFPPREMPFIFQYPRRRTASGRFLVGGRIAHFIMAAPVLIRVCCAHFGRPDQLILLSKRQLDRIELFRVQ